MLAWAKTVALGGWVSSGVDGSQYFKEMNDPTLDGLQTKNLEVFFQNLIRECLHVRQVLRRRGTGGRLIPRVHAIL
jgi:hypothetical protein